MASLSAKVSARSQEDLRPKTRQAYFNMFRVFVAFCIFNKMLLSKIDEKVVMAFLESLVVNHCSTCVVTNYVSAVKAYFVLCDLNYLIFDHPKIKYYLKSLGINRPLSVKSHNLIDMSWLISISTECANLTYLQCIELYFSQAFSNFLGC